MSRSIRSSWRISAGGVQIAASIAGVEPEAASGALG